MDDNPRHVSAGDAESRDMSRYSSTVADAVNLFDEAGVPRSGRTIQRYCKRGHLDCYRLDREQDVTYLIDPESIERRIEELRQLTEMNMSSGVALQRAMPRQDAPGRDTPQQESGSESRSESEDDQDLSRRIKELEEERRKLADAMSLKEIEIKVKDKLLVDLNEQRRKDLEYVASLGEEVGEWKTKFLQLSAPNEPPLDRPRDQNEVIYESDNSERTDPSSAPPRDIDFESNADETRGDLL